MAKKLTLKAAQDINPVDVVAVINGGIQFVDAVAPVAKVLFAKINEFIKSLNLGKNNPNSAQNVRKRLAALEAKDTLQKQVNKLVEDRLTALETKN
jgi:hypothetical protein